MDCIGWASAERVYSGIIRDWVKVRRGSTSYGWLAELTMRFRKDVVTRAFVTTGFDGVEVRAEHVKVHLDCVGWRTQREIGIPVTHQFFLPLKLPRDRSLFSPAAILTRLT
jgi:hypothetical protein